MVSVIIPVLNQPDMTEECLAALRETTNDYELIIVDNGSSPPVRQPFMGFVDVTVLRNEKNLGFPVAINEAMMVAKGDQIVLLNNDVIVTPHWLERLQGWLDQYDIVGPMTNFAAGVQMVKMPYYSTREQLFDLADDCEEDDIAIPVNYITGFCMLFTREVWDACGPFDTSLWPCSGEELDFCFKAKEKGFNIGVARDVYVHHHGSATFRELWKETGLEYEDVCVATNKHLAERWGDDFWVRQPVALPEETSNERDVLLRDDAVRG